MQTSHYLKMVNKKHCIPSMLLDVPSLLPSFLSFGPEFNDDRKHFGSPHSLDYTDGKFVQPQILQGKVINQAFYL
jgi:hypothetical protein